jgi:acyl dehydratase
VFLNLNLDFRAPVRPGDVIAGEIEVVGVRPDKAITNLRVAVIRQDGVTAVDGTAVTYTVPPPVAG